MGLDAARRSPRTRASAHAGRSTGSRRAATGFLGATNLAVSHGDVYVSELFAGKVTKLHHGRRSTLVRVPRPVAVEVKDHRTYVGQLADLDQGSGTVKAPGSVRVYHRR